jgi:hypothetical protein
MLDLRKQLAFRYAIAPRLVGHDYPRREIEIKGIVVRLAGQTIEASLRRSFRPLGKVVTPDDPAAIYAAGSSEVPICSLRWQLRPLPSSQHEKQRIWCQRRWWHVVHPESS